MRWRWSLVLAVLAVSCGAQETRYAGWDRFYYKFQLPIKAAAPQTQVRMSVYHSYPSSLHNVRVVAKSDAFTLTTHPQVVRVLDPTEIRSIVLSVRRRDTGAARTGQPSVRLALRLTADELADSRPVLLTIPLTLAAEGPVAEALAVPVGQMQVTVNGLGRAAIYLYAALTVLLLVWFFRRRAKAA